MSFPDAVLVLACAVLTLAWLESQFGLRISRHWHRAYDALTDALRHTPPHLRGRVPMECGMGTPSETQLREVVRVARVRRTGVGDSLDGWNDVVLEAMDKERRERATEKSAFEDWLDARCINPPAVFEYEALRDVWRREQSAMANRSPSVREQVGLANARAFQQRHWDVQMHRPTPAENARRYASEGGTW